MTNSDFWNKVAEKWATEDDGIDIVIIDDGEFEEFEFDINSEEISEEIEDILANLDLDI